MAVEYAGIVVLLALPHFLGIEIADDPKTDVPEEKEEQSGPPEAVGDGEGGGLHGAL
jgi:hypothetical protein